MPVNNTLLLRRAASIAAERNELFILVHFADGWAIPERADHDGAWPQKLAHPIRCFPTSDEALSDYLARGEKDETLVAKAKEICRQYIDGLGDQPFKHQQLAETLCSVFTGITLGQWLDSAYKTWESEKKVAP